MLKLTVNDVLTPVYSDENAVFVTDPSNPTGKMITLKDRLGMGSGVGNASLDTISASAYNELAKNGQLVTNKVYFVEEG